VTSYSVALAVSAPVFSIMLRSMPTVRLLRLWTVLLVFANICAACAPGHWWLQAARCVAAGGAVACAFGVIVATVSADRVGRHLGFATFGVMGFVTAGVPLAVVASAVGWRWLFVGIAALSVVVLVASG